MKKINGFSLGKDNECTLMIWDTNQKTYNKPDRQTNVNSKVEINVGDVILLPNNNENKISMVVKEVLSERPSSLKGYLYYELLTDRKVNES